MSKRAIITGITGQDGSYLAELLLEQGYEVVGATRRLSAPNHWRIAHLLDRIRPPVAIQVRHHRLVAAGQLTVDDVGDEARLDRPFRR